MRLVEAVSAPLEVGGTTLSLTMSIGLALATDTNIQLDELLRQADTAMYKAKTSGRGRWELFEPGDTRG